MLHQRGLTKKNSKRMRERNKKCRHVVFQIDKSTCLSYNIAENELRYRRVSSQAFQSMIDEIALDFAIDLTVSFQPTHTFDFNFQDATTFA